MALVNIDTTNEKLLEKPVYTPIPAGIYDFAVASKSIKIERSKGGNNMIKVESRCISDFAYTGSDGVEKNAKGSKFTEYFVLNEDSAWKLAQFCKAIGVESEEGKLDTDDFLGQEFSAKLKIGTYKKEEVNDEGVTEEVTKFKNEIEEYVWETE